MTLKTSLFATTAVNFKHRNRKLLCVMRVHHLLQNVNDLTKRRLCSTFCV